MNIFEENHLVQQSPQRDYSMLRANVSQIGV